MALRLDKYLTELGIGTRSEVKKLIKAKQITVNGASAVTPETKVNEQMDEVRFRGKKLTYASYEYYLFHKPAGCVSATEDRMHRTVMDYLTDTVRSDLFPVGRLDIDTEGLLLVTNDGALAHELLSPAKHVAKTYYARVAGKVTKEDVNLFEKGIDIGEDKLTKPAKLVILSNNTSFIGENAGNFLPEDRTQDGKNGILIPEDGILSEIELTITEGKFHQVKRMFEAVGKKVVYLKRLSMGPLVLPKELAPGEYRALTGEELAALKAGHYQKDSKE